MQKLIDNAIRQQLGDQQIAIIAAEIQFNAAKEAALLAYRNLAGVLASVDEAARAAILQSDPQFAEWHKQTQAKPA